MKVCRFVRGGRTQLGLALDEGAVIGLDDIFLEAGLGAAPSSVPELLDRIFSDRSSFEKASDLARQRKELCTPVDRWLPPVTPGKVLGVAINNQAFRSIAIKNAEHPAFFMKATSSLIGHGEPIVVRPDYGLTHPEGEVGVVIGRQCKLVDPAKALDYVFGFTVINDVTSVGLKSEDTYVWPNPGQEPPPPGFEFGNMQLAYHARSKGTDTFGPCGPWIVTRDEIPNANDLKVQVYMGDELCANDHTANLRHSVAEVVSWASRFFTLEPGDLIHVGTAASGKYGLRELDFRAWDGPCAVEIERIGRLSNPVVRQDIEGQPVAAIAKSTAKPWPPRSVSAR
jgi:2-keto-4-pentenoate hydratase/2-oxohepta-3-ene-1,7-dioic acid hydratase in catechol pathway